MQFGNLGPGNKTVHTDRIVDISGLPTGKIFSPKEVSLATTRLQKTGSFRVAALSEVDEIAQDGTLDIKVQITEGPLRRYGIGAEVSSL